MRKFLNTKVKDMKAITLIALVITIVVLIILAAVAINLSLGNNSIFNRAKTAKEQYQNAEADENLKVESVTNSIDSLTIASSDRSSGPNSENTMSGTEHFIGEYYLDGKPIYERTFYIASLPNAADKTYNHNISNVDNIWINSSKSYFHWPDNYFSEISFSSPSGIQFINFIAVNSSNIRFYTSTNRSDCSAYITLRYTKTTDTATKTIDATTLTAN